MGIPGGGGLDSGVLVLLSELENPEAPARKSCSDAQSHASHQIWDQARLTQTVGGGEGLPASVVQGMVPFLGSSQLFFISVVGHCQYPMAFHRAVVFQVLFLVVVGESSKE